MSLPEKTSNSVPEQAAAESYQDLRQWLNIVDGFGELERIDDADWNLEVGTVAELIYRERSGLNPALLFDHVKGYPKGFRILVGQNASFRRLALTLNLPADGDGIALVDRFRKKLSTLKPLPPRVVKDGPILENQLTGNDLDLLKFPVPVVHELDGGRFIGTGCVAITRDPDEGWANLGTYRAMVHDRNSMGLFTSSVTKHAHVHMEKYFRQGKPCPVALCVGQDPLLLLGGGSPVDFSSSEYDYCGGLRGRPYDVVLGDATGLPFPAHAEIVIEGFMKPGDVKAEGPFGEWMGYYGAKTTDTPVVHVEKIYHRNDPILCCARPGRTPTDYSLVNCVITSAHIWNNVEKAGLPNVKAVWSLEPGVGRLFNVISIKQAYPGHARQALFLASQVLGGAYLGRFVIVVDDDVDPTNMSDVLWAIGTRCDPEYAIEIIRRCGSGMLDVVIPRERKGHSSRALIDACIPYERRSDYPPVAESSDELKAKMREKWKRLLQKR